MTLLYGKTPWWLNLWRDRRLAEAMIQVDSRNQRPVTCDQCGHTYRIIEYPAGHANECPKCP